MLSLNFQSAKLIRLLLLIAKCNAGFKQFTIILCTLVSKNFVISLDLHKVSDHELPYNLEMSYT